MDAPFNERRYDIIVGNPPWRSSLTARLAADYVGQEHGHTDWQISKLRKRFYGVLRHYLLMKVAYASWPPAKVCCSIKAAPTGNSDVNSS